MPLFRSQARHRAFARKSRVHLGALSPGDGVLIAMTVVRSASGSLHREASKLLKSGEAMPVPEFSRIVGTVVERRRGSVYASFVTSVDHLKVFHADRFATALKRLGVLDDIRQRMEASGHHAMGHVVATYAPWYWADLTARELRSVKKETAAPIRRAMAEFREELGLNHLDEMLESAILRAPPTSVVPRLAMGAAQFDPGSAARPRFVQAFRALMGRPTIGLLDRSSSVEATFEAFYQRLLTDTDELRKMAPRPAFQGVRVTPERLRTLFSDGRLKRSLLMAFRHAYDRAPHAVRLARLYDGIEIHGVPDTLRAAARSRLGLDLDGGAVSGVLAGLIGMFFTFVADAGAHSPTAVDSRTA